ncbi:MAG: hypothetical protein PHY20_09035 [Bacteroidales bacterium]|nr:hypothetical protein [Bacteroidales bacterium]
MKIKNIFTEIHLVIENIMPIFAAIQYKKEFKMKGSFLHKAAAPPPLPPAECRLRRNQSLLQRKNLPFMDTSSPAAYIFLSQQLPSAFSSSRHKICYPKASAFSFQFVLTYLLPIPFFLIF